MGSFNSTMLCEEEIEELKNTTVFDYREIEHLYERFQLLDKESHGYLTYNELNNIPEFHSNPFSHLIMKSIEKRADYEKMTFPHFLEFLGIFSEKNSKKGRTRYLFDIFDLNGDGRLCRNVLLRIYRTMGQQGGEKETENILNIYDEGGKGYLDLSDFTKFYNSDPSIDQNMLIDFSKNLRQHKQDFGTHLLMFFKKKGEIKPPAVEEELEILSNRLEGSIYYEDKLNTLTAILETSKVHPVITGTYALQNVICSMEEMEDVSVQLAILSNIFLCTHKLEFVEMTIKDLNSLRVLCDCLKLQKNEKEAYDLLCKLSISDLFPSQMLKIPNVAYYCAQMVKEKKVALLPMLIEKDSNFKKQIIFEGIFEAILHALDRSYSKEVISILALLLRDCSFNQDYFNELDWKKIVMKHLSLHPEEVFEVLVALIDLKNTQAGRLQDSVYGVAGLKLAFEYRQWRLIYLIIRDNLSYTREFVEKILTADNIAKSFAKDSYCKQNEACLLINYLLLHKNLEVPDLSSYKIYAIQSLREQNIPTSSLMKKAFEEVRGFDGTKEGAVFDALVFIIFNFDISLAEEMVPVFIDIFNDYTKPKLHRNLCLIALLMFETSMKRINVNNYGVIHSLKETRQFLCSIDLASEFYLVDEMIDILLDNISDLISKHNVQVDKDRYEHKPDGIEEKSNSSPMSSVVSFFSFKKEDNKKDAHEIHDI